MTMRRPVVLIVVLSLFTACTGGAQRHLDRLPRATGSPVHVSRLEPVVLRADLSDRPSRWHLVTSVPFGPHRDELGILRVGRHTDVPLVPYAFGVGPDRSFWFLDPVKRRVSHYSSSGAYLGQIRGFRFDRFHPHPRDLVMAGPRPVVLEQGLGLAGIVDLPSPGRGFTRTPVRAGGRGVAVSWLIQTERPVVGWVEGRPLDPPEPPILEPAGIARFEVPGSGEIHALPGLPLGDGNHISLELRGAHDLEARFTDRHGASVLPVRIEVVAGGRKVPAVLGPETQTALEHAIVSYVQLTPSEPGVAARFGGGRWFLELSDDGSPLLWERLPEPSFDDETMVRHLTAGPDGAVYLMQADRSGVSVYRR